MTLARTEGLEFGSTWLVDVSLPVCLGTFIRCYWAASFGHFKDWWTAALGCVSISWKPSHLAVSMGRARAGCVLTTLTSSAEQGGSCGLHKQGLPAGLRLGGLFSFFSQYLIDQCAWRSMVLVLNRKVSPSKVQWVHTQGAAPQAAAEMTPDQTPVFGRKFRLLCWYLFLSF